MVMLKCFLLKCRDFIFKLRQLYSDWSYLKMFSNSKRKAECDVYLSLLRKNCHVLDKGLHVIPFEKGHGKMIYNEALAFKKKLENTSCVNDPSFHWCNQILAAYEQAQINGSGCNNMAYHVYSDEEKQNIYDFFHSRISCRYFSYRRVDESVWNKIVEVAADAPNGCCRQTSRVYVVSEKKLIQKLLVNIAGATGFSNGIPYLLCITADTRPYMIIDRMLAYIDASLFVENLVLACRVNNIFTTILNFQYASEKERKAVSECLNIPDYERIIIFIAAGYVDFVPEKPVRMAVDKFRKL